MNEARSDITSVRGTEMHNPVLGDAFRRVAQELGGDENLNPESIKGILRSKGVIGESPEEIGKEVGAIAGDEIVKNSGIINPMSSEKPPENQAEQFVRPQPPEKQQQINDLVVKINALEAQGKGEEAKKLEEELQNIYTGKEPPHAPESINTPNETPGSGVSYKDPAERDAGLRSAEEIGSVVYQTPDGEIVPTKLETQEASDRGKQETKLLREEDPANILRKIDDWKKKREEAAAKIRDPLHKDITEPTAIIVEADKRIKELEHATKTDSYITTARAATPDTAAHVKAVAEPVAPESIQPQPQEQVQPVTPATEEAIPVKQEVQEQQTPFEKIIARIKTEDPARAERLLDTIGANQEQRAKIEKLLGAVETHAQKTGQETKEKDPWVIEHFRKAGDWYRKQPLKRKLLISGALIGSAMASAAVGGATAGIVATVAFTGSLTQRTLGSLGVAVAVEGIFAKRALEKGAPEERIMGMRMSTVKGALAGLGVFAAGSGIKFFGEYLHGHIGDGAPVPHAPPVPETMTPPPPPPEPLGMNSQEILAGVQKEIHETMPLPHEAVAEAGTPSVVHESILEHAPSALEATYTVHNGENLWNILKEKFPEIQTLDGQGRQSNAIANIIEQIKKDPESFGIKSGNVDALATGDTLDLQKIKDVLDNTRITIGGHEASILERAHALTDAEAAHIVESGGAHEIAHHATTQAAESNGLSEITKDYTLGMPDTGGKTIEQLSAEALAGDTGAALHADVQTMFGSRGLFGYGFLGTNGERSIDWLDLKSRTVSEVLSKKFEGAPWGEEGGVTKFGIDSYAAVDKMKGYLTVLIEKSGLKPESGERVEGFAKRALGSIIKQQ